MSKAASDGNTSQILSRIHAALTGNISLCHHAFYIPQTLIVLYIHNHPTPMYHFVQILLFVFVLLHVKLKKKHHTQQEVNDEKEKV